MCTTRIAWPTVPAALAATLIAIAGCGPTVTITGTPDAGRDSDGRGPAAPGLATSAPAGRVRGVAADAPIDPRSFPPVEHEGPVRVAATVGQVADIARSVGGNRVAVTQIVPGNDDPHRYVPTPRDVATLGESDIVLYSGLFLEGQMAEILGELGRFGVPTAAVTAGFSAEQLLAHEYESGETVADPHVWFDPELWRQAAANAAAVLTALDPAGAEHYAANLEEYQSRLRALDSWGRESIASVPESRRVLVTSHDAFGYLGRRFGLNVIGLQGLSTEAEAGTRDVSDLGRLIVERGIPAVFVEAGVSPEALQAVVESVRAGGAEVDVGGKLFSDSPGAEGTAEGTYAGMALWNLATITSALGGALPPLPPALGDAAPWDYDALVRRAAASAVAGERRTDADREPVRAVTEETP